MLYTIFRFLDSIFFVSKMAMSVKKFSFDEAVSHLLISNGVTLEKAVRGKGIFDTMSSGMAWTVSKTECQFEESEIETTCETLGKAKRWPPAVLKEVKNVSSLNDDGIYVCSGGCTAGRSNGLLVFLTLAYKENSKINLLVVTSDQNVSIAPEEIERIVTTVKPIMTTGKWTINIGSINYEYKYQKKIGEQISSHVEVEKSERHLTEYDLASLRDFCLSKVCQKFLGRQRCEAFAGPEEIRQILCYDFDQVKTSVEKKSAKSQKHAQNSYPTEFPINAENPSKSEHYATAVENPTNFCRFNTEKSFHY